MLSTENKVGYKMTKLGWIPAEWGVAMLNELVRFQSGFAFSSEFFKDCEGLKLVTPKNFTKFGFASFNKNNTKWTTEEIEGKYLCQEGDLLVLLTDLTPTCELLGKPLLLREEDGQVLLNQRIVKIAPEKKLRKDFLQKWLLSSQYSSWIKSTASGSTVKHSSNKSLGLSVIPLPPLPEQEKIARILSTWDKGIATLNQLIAAKEQRKKALMQQLLTGKKRFAGFTDEWKEVKLGEVAAFKNGKGHENNVDEDGKYVLVNSKFVASEGREYKKVNVAHGILNEGEIVMVMSDVPNGKALAKCYLISENNKFTLNQRICSISSKSVNIMFLMYQLNRNKFYMKFDSGVGQTNLKKQEVLNCPIYIPSQKEQQKIASALSAADNEIVQLKAQVKKLQQQKKGLLQQLLTGAVRVKI